MRAVNRRGSVLERLSEVAAPTLLVFGDEDGYTPVAAGRRMLTPLRDGLNQGRPARSQKAW
mgnify:CR=1 FL=1